MFWSEIHIFMIRMLLGDPPALDYEQQSQLPNLFCRLWQQVLQFVACAWWFFSFVFVFVFSRLWQQVLESNARTTWWSLSLVCGLCISPPIEIIIIIDCVHFATVHCHLLGIYYIMWRRRLGKIGGRCSGVEDLPPPASLSPLSPPCFSGRSRDMQGLRHLQVSFRMMTLSKFWRHRSSSSSSWPTSWPSSWSSWSS